jgi:flagellar hook-associated protein 1 FlgK
MGSSVFNIGVTGLNAANMGLTTTGHNIANANTDGFSRQTIKQSAPYPMLSGSGFSGLGVQVDSITRIYDRFLTKAVEVAQAQSSYQETRFSHLSEINNIVADPTAGVSPALQEFFSAMQNVATNPANPPARQALLANAQTMINRFQVFSDRLNEQRSALNGEITNTVSNINAYAQQIGDLNNKIVIAQSSGQPPNDLLDQRDLLVKQLNSLVKTNTLEMGDGSINVFIGSGQGLVVGSQVYSLAAVPSQGDPERITVAYQQNNTTIMMPENLLSGGMLGGLLDYRNQSLDLAQNSLERTALGLMESFNQQHKTGQDMNGLMGSNFFGLQRSNSVDFNVAGQNIRVTTPANSIPGSDFSITPNGGGGYDIKRLSDGLTSVGVALGTTDPATGLTLSAAPAGLTLPVQSSFSFPPALGSVVSNSNNTGNATLGGYITDVSKLSASDYEFGFDGTNYYTLRQNDGLRTSYTPAQVASGITQDGFTFNIDSGAMNAGDRITIKPLHGVIDSMSVRITDPKGIAAASPIISSLPGSNTGTLKATQPLTDAPSLSSTDAAFNPALKNPVTINFTSPNSFTYTDAVTGVTSPAQVYTAGMTLSVNGWSMKLDGAPATGDVVKVDLNVNGSADNRNALALGKLQTTRLLEGGSATYQESYGRMVSTIGTQTSEANVMGKAQAKLLSSSETSRDSVSAVNLDEEAANLLRYQQAYQASSKVIQIAQQAFDEILNIGR